MNDRSFANGNGGVSGVSGAVVPLHLRHQRQYAEWVVTQQHWWMTV